MGKKSKGGKAAPRTSPDSGAPTKSAAQGARKAPGARRKT